MTDKEIIRIENLSFTYPRMSDPLLRHINLKIQDGELVILTGANGSGKTTLGKCINGLIPYSTGGLFEGTVEVCGVNTLQRNVSELALYVGFVFSNPEDQLATTLVETEIAFGLSNLGIPREMIYQKVDAILDRMGIEQLRDTSTFNLSTGQKQLVAIASSLVMEPRVLILDDPLSHLNQNISVKVIEIMKDLSQKGTTIIWISQDMSEMFECADRVVLLDEGRIVFNGSPHVMAQEMDSENLAVIIPQYLEFSHALVKAGFPHAVIEPSLDQTIHELRGFMTPFSPVVEKQEAKGIHDGKTSESMIRFDRVTFRYPNGVLALKEIALEFYAGDFVLLSGWNGSGKTTLAKHINGLLRPTEGAVFIFGEDISRKPTSDLAKDVGFLFQNPDHQLHKPTVRDELMFSLKNFGLPDERIGEKVSEISERFNLGSLLDRVPQELSGSEKKKVTVASIVIYDPKIVVLDEATANLDRNQAKSIIEIMEDYLDEDKIIFAISHDMRMWTVSDRLNRIIIMKEGVVVDEGKPEQILCNPEIMNYLYGALLPVTEIALSLKDRGIEPTHYKASTLVQQIDKVWRSPPNAFAER